MSTIDILAIFAHPDDVELAVGGTLLKMKSLGYRTGAIDVTRGEMGTRGTVDGRAQEALEAARVLKLDVRENLELPDGRVFADDESRVKLVRVLRRLRPKVVLTHQEGDPHPDHAHIVQLVREASRLASMAKYGCCRRSSPTRSFRGGSHRRSSLISVIFSSRKWRR